MSPGLLLTSSKLFVFLFPSMQPPYQAGKEEKKGGKKLNSRLVKDHRFLLVKWLTLENGEPTSYEALCHCVHLF